MTIFHDAIDDIFDDENVGEAALYFPAGQGQANAVRVIAAQPDVVTEFSDTRLARATSRFEVRASEVAAPRAGDAIEFKGQRYIVQGAPQADADRLVWTLDTYPETRA
ncbi:MAG TPA: hypothetical protein VLG66_13115 [Alphaproteobacteria bacterium]|nr:hypothetical protein [Alphaproteobacteria bacterium]